MTYLQTSTGLTARIHSLPGREPFMLAADLAAVYETETENVTRAVRRNPDRFPPHHAFRLTEAELVDLRRQNGGANMISSLDRTLPLAFTLAGATGLSAVLKTPVAARVHVMVHDAFAAMQRDQMDAMRYTMVRLQLQAKRQSPVRVTIIDGAAAGLTFDAIWRMTSLSQPKLAQIARDLMGMGLIAALPDGTPPAEQDLFAAAGGKAHG